MSAPETVADVIDLLNARIRKMREVADAEPENRESCMAHAFHLMEVRLILEGKYTCGVYDDFGPPEGKKAGDARS